ncbi:hypothetical protein B296_00032884 [Ensete ventricosum]|uniref:Uncharacterized protein n=1 Tax=Ensete ventricosum TaxID=4639 RepID=A0A426Z6T9_ENSVE|nr:hypothetical protein B296_00032884 [Ensete ventricosum]
MMATGRGSPECLTDARVLGRVLALDSAGSLSSFVALGRVLALHSAGSLSSFVALGRVLALHSDGSVSFVALGGQDPPKQCLKDSCVGDGCSVCWGLQGRRMHARRAPPKPLKTDTYPSRYSALTPATLTRSTTTVGPTPSLLNYMKSLNPLLVHYFNDSKHP